MKICQRCKHKEAAWKINATHTKPYEGFLCTLCKESYEMETSNSLGKSWMDENIRFVLISVEEDGD